MTPSDRRREIEQRRRKVYAAAAQDGLEPGSLRAVHEFRRLAGKVRARLDRTEVQQFEALAIAFSGSDFGRHCAERAAQAHAQGRPNGAAAVA
jgi:hypothetical protein